MPVSAPIVAVIGGGQLARMMQEEASALGIHLRALVEAPDGSTALVTVDSPVGAADDVAAVRALAAGAGALTFEHEHQDDALLRQLVAEGARVRPSPDALLLARDKIAMRRAMDAAGLPQPAWAEAAGDAASIREAVRGSPPSTAGPSSSRRLGAAMTGMASSSCARSAISRPAAPGSGSTPSPPVARPAVAAASAAGP
ncbi:phosphoribosylaminoimidazole carboxylase, ATPase subunit [Actinomyces denticolens]|nr:phosphoribosylaminoimidazole carboxylase, ATPase subunit [Actinomyces denticolens]